MRSSLDGLWGPSQVNLEARHALAVSSSRSSQTKVRLSKTQVTPPTKIERSLGRFITIQSPYCPRRARWVGLRARLRATPFHARTSPLSQAQNWRRWSGHLAVSSYELHHDREYWAIRNSAALIDVCTSRYRTPIAGLYLCGAGTHPGGGVTGMPGFNAAREILRD